MYMSAMDLPDKKNKNISTKPGWGSHDLQKETHLRQCKNHYFQKDPKSLKSVTNNDDLQKGILKIKQIKKYHGATSRRSQTTLNPNFFKVFQKARSNHKKKNTTTDNQTSRKPLKILRQP